MIFANCFLLAFLSYKIFSIPSFTGAWAYSTATFLTPLRDLQIAVRLPDTHCSGCKEWESTARAAIKFLAKTSVPAQIFPKHEFRSKSNLSFQHTRYTENKFACLIYAAIEPNQEQFELSHLTTGCDSWTQKRVLVHQAQFGDLVLLTLLHRRTPSWTSQEKFRLERCSSPLFLLVFHHFARNVGEIEGGRKQVEFLDVCFGSKPKFICQIVLKT